ncbi:MAG: PQQ-dependent sugar dehydrogenase, partial [Planctomycetaceae bacterium]|nr:PQQ-dependent sugar dehydrogenase [Planctomycetaceae bacterium]
MSCTWPALFPSRSLLQRRRKSRGGCHLVCGVESLELRLCLSVTQPGSGAFTETVVASGLTGATAMQFSPDGKLFIAEEAGTMEVWDGGVRLQADFFVNSPITTQIVSERGLLGIAFDPDYANNRFIYVYYTTTAADNHNRVSRFTANAEGDLALANSEHMIMELDPHSAGNHNGGAMHFGLDGMLYIAVGDNADGSNAQSLDNRHGKMLRIDVHTDDFADPGQNYGIPEDNPTEFPGISGSTSGVNQSIWAVGLRNPFTFSVQPGTGRIFINDVGQNTWEEINDGFAGANYGWNTTEGDFNQTSFPNFTRPFYTYDQGGVEPNGCAITGGVFYNPTVNQFPTEFHGDYFFADFCGGKIWHIDLTTRDVNEFAFDLSSPVDLKVDDAGALYYLARGSGQVVRVSFVSESPIVLETQINGAANPNRSGIRELAITFDQDVTVDAADALTLFNHTTSQSVNVSGATLLGNGTTTVTWLLADGPGGMTDIVLPDGLYTAQLAAIATTPALDEPFEFEFHKLAGDVDGDALVNFNDYFAVREEFDESGEIYRPGDADGDGLVNFNDYFAIRENFDAGLPAMMTAFTASQANAPTTGLLASAPQETSLAAVSITPPEVVAVAHRLDSEND